MIPERLFALFLTLVVAAANVACGPSEFDREFMAGEVERSQAHYKEAIAHFERAVALKPDSVEAHFALARSYDDLELPVDMDIEEFHAIREYQRVIQLQPDHKHAMKYLGYLYLVIRSDENSEKYYRMALAVDPNDVDSLYSVAVIKWRSSYQVRMETLNRLRSKILIRTSACNEVRRQNLDRLNNGIELIEKVLSTIQDRDAVAWAALLYKERAEIQCSDRPAYMADIASAKHWDSILRSNYCPNPKNSISWKYPKVAPAPPPLATDFPRCD
jgi:tetratricopeptide (TPR) repeat protein